MEPDRTASTSKTVLILAVVAAAAAVLRYFMKGWVEPLGVPTAVGSFLASVTVVLLIGLVLIFVGRLGASVGVTLRQQRGSSL